MSSTRYIQLASAPEQKKPANAPADKKNHTALKSDLFFPLLPDLLSIESTDNNISTVTGYGFDRESFRQPPASFICCSLDACSTFLNNSAAPEQHTYARTWRRQMLDLCETPLHATNYCAYTHCYPANNKHTKKTRCLDVAGCLCICCAVRVPTYAVKSVFCCFAGAAGFVADQLPCVSHARNAPTLQTMDDIYQLIAKHDRLNALIEFKKNDGFSLVLEQDQKPYWKNSAGLVMEDKSLDALLQNEKVYEEHIVIFFRQFLSDKSFRQDYAALRHGQGEVIRPKIIARAVVEYHGKQPFSIAERLQVLAYLWEYGFNFVNDLLLDAAISSNYEGADQVLDFILSKIYRADHVNLRSLVQSDTFYSNSFDKELDHLFSINPDRASRKAMLLQKYQLNIARIDEIAQWLATKTAFKMAKHPRLGANSRLFTLPMPVFHTILSFYDGIPRYKK